MPKRDELRNRIEDMFSAEDPDPHEKADLENKPDLSGGLNLIFLLQTEIDWERKPEGKPARLVR